MTNLELRNIIREELQKVLKQDKTPKLRLSEGLLDTIKGWLGKAKKEAPQKSPAGKKIIGMDFDGYYIDEDGNRV